MVQNLSERRERFLSLNEHTETIQTSGTLKVTLISYSFLSLSPSLSHTNTHIHVYTLRTTFFLHTYQLLQSEKLVATLRSDTCSGFLGTCKPIWVKVRRFANDSGACLTGDDAKRSLKSRQIFFLTVF